MDIVRDEAFKAHKERNALRDKVAAGRQSTAALSAKGTKPKRASKKASTVSA